MIANQAAIVEYLVGHGASGDFGRYRPRQPMRLLRGEDVVVRSFRGLELGRVLCPARPGHAAFLPNTTVGELIRKATSQDVAAASESRERSVALLRAAQESAQSFSLPLEILDAEILLDGEHGILHHVRWSPFDERDLISALSRRFGLKLTLFRASGGLTDIGETEPEEGSCGAENCGHGHCDSDHGACATCGIAAAFASKKAGASPHLN